MSPRDLQIIISARLAEEIVTATVVFWDMNLSLAANSFRRGFREGKEELEG